MRLNEYGQIVCDEWFHTAVVRPDVVVDSAHRVPPLALNAIRRYVPDNPLHWNLDRQNFAHADSDLLI